MELIPPNVLIDEFVKLSLLDIFRLCQVNQFTFGIIKCEYFWKRKILLDYEKCFNLEKLERCSTPASSIYQILSLNFSCDKEHLKITCMDYINNVINWRVQDFETIKQSFGFIYRLCPPFKGNIHIQDYLDLSRFEGPKDPKVLYGIIQFPIPMIGSKILDQCPHFNTFYINCIRALLSCVNDLDEYTRIKIAIINLVNFINRRALFKIVEKKVAKAIHDQIVLLDNDM